MNDPILGFVVGLLCTFCFVSGYRFGRHHERLERAVSDKKNAVPKGKISWLKPNWFRRAERDPQESFDFNRIKMQ